MFCSPSPTASMINDIKLPSFTELVTSIEECSNCSSPISGGASSFGSPHSYSSEREIGTERNIVEPSFFHTMLPRIIRNDVNIPAPQFHSMAPLMVSTTQLPAITPTLQSISPNSKCSTASSPSSTSSMSMTTNHPHPTYPHYASPSRLPTPPASATIKELRDPKRKHVCKVCSRCFTTSGHLARHNRIHTGERKHQCPWPTCSARFARQDNCMQHYKTHTNTKNKESKLNFKEGSFSSKYYQTTPSRILAESVS